MSDFLVARQPYTKRPVPSLYSSPWFLTELGNVQRAIPVFSVITVRDAYRMKATDFTVLVNSLAPVTITLPPPDQVFQALWHIKSINSGVVTIQGVVDGVTNPTLSSAYDGMLIQSSGTEYLLLSQV